MLRWCSPWAVAQDDLERPSEEEELKTAAKTRAAMEQLVTGKIAAAHPLHIEKSKGARDPKFVRYTPDVNTPGYNANAKQRVIRMVEAQVDPMEPPSFKHKKVARGPPEAPVPVMHSPPRKVTVQDQQAWKIPPCVSNWKNAKGYTIPLDKRLAADGRGLQEVTINDNFASLAESLYIAERKAREEVKYRSTIQKKISQKEKEQQEAELRDLASKARLERQGISVGGGRDESRDTRDERDDDSGYWKVTTLVNSFANRSAFVVFSEPKIVTRTMAQKPGRIETSKRKEINCGWIANANASGRYVCAI